MKLILSLLCTLTFSLASDKADIRMLDSLYQAKDFDNFLEISKELLKEKPEYKNNFEFLLKLANASFKAERYNLSKQIYGLAASKDSILNDYINYHFNLSLLHLGDTLKFYENTESFYNKNSDSYLAINLLRQAVNITNEKSDTVHFLKFAELYSQKRRLHSTTAFKRLQLTPREDNESIWLNEQISFLKNYASSAYAEIVIDSIYQYSEIDSLKDDELFYLIRAAVQNDFRHDSLIQYYDRVEHIDDEDELMLDYLLTEKKSSEAIKLIKKAKEDRGKISQKLARSLPRLLNRLKQTNAAHIQYLEFARIYPNHPFALNAVTFVMGRTEKKNLKFFRNTMREFTERPSKYKQYYRFRHVLHYYERKDFKTAMSLINRYLKAELSNYHKTRLLFWKGKLLFELNKREDGFLMLERLAKQPFNSYYNMKSYISLIENERDSLIPHFENVRSAKLSVDDTYWESYRRFKLVDNVYGDWFSKEELRRTKFSTNVESDYHSLIDFYKGEKLYQKAFLTALRYRSRFKNRDLLSKKSDVQNFTFPEYYRASVSKAAQRFEMDSALIWAVIYRESAFQADAKSKANAHGLMQLLPSTGKQTAKRLKLDYKNVYSLYESDFNVQLGSYHLKKLLDRFDGKIELALAAYNAGASRVKKWKKQYSTGNMELFIEKIPFEQTRTYVKKILYAYYAYRILDDQAMGSYYSGIKARSN